MCSKELLEKDLSGRTILVTGGNSGIGLTTVKQLAKQGAEVVLCARKLEVAQKLAEEISKESRGSVRGFQLDLGSLESVRECAENFSKTFEKLDVLVNNAGVMNPPLSRTKEGFEMQFGVNHLGHFLLTSLLKPSLDKSTDPRVICVSSVAHETFQGSTAHIDFDDLNWEKRQYKGWVAYGQSKLANVLHSKELTKRWDNITSVSLHPGFVKSNLARHSVPWLIRPIIGPIFRMMGMINPWDGAQAHLYCILSPDIEKGAYYAQNNSPSKKKGGWPFPSPNEAVNDENAAKLWEASEKLVGL